MVKSEREKQELKEALNKAIALVESTVSWAEAKDYTNEQEYLDFEDTLNKLSIKDHNINFFSYKHVD